MELFTAFITACGGGIVAGLFGLISSARERKREKKKEDSAVLKKLGELEKKLDDHITADNESKANNARSMIIQFGDEVRRGTKHTEENWNNILLAVDRYEDFCANNPGYENNRAVRTIEYIKGVYDERLIKNDFL